MMPDTVRLQPILGYGLHPPRQRSRSALPWCVNPRAGCVCDHAHLRCGICHRTGQATLTLQAMQTPTLLSPSTSYHQHPGSRLSAHCMNSVTAACSTLRPLLSVLSWHGRALQLQGGLILGFLWLRPVRQPYRQGSPNAPRRVPLLCATGVAASTG